MTKLQIGRVLPQMLSWTIVPFRCRFQCCIPPVTLRSWRAEVCHRGKATGIVSSRPLSTSLTPTAGFSEGLLYCFSPKYKYTWVGCFDTHSSGENWMHCLDNSKRHYGWGGKLKQWLFMNSRYIHIPLPPNNVENEVLLSPLSSISSSMDQECIRSKWHRIKSV